MPSAKYALSGSWLRFSNGNTAMDFAFCCSAEGDAGALEGEYTALLVYLTSKPPIASATRVTINITALERGLPNQLDNCEGKEGFLEHLILLGSSGFPTRSV